jgi:carbamoyl-phosphate synthase small subunit
VRHLRDQGSKRGVIGSAEQSEQALVARARAVKPMAGCDLASVVTTEKSYPWVKPSYVLPANGRGAEALAGARLAGAAAPLGRVRPAAATREPEQGFRVIVLDCGVKWNILRRLVDVGCSVTDVPATTSASDILGMKPHGIVISNGPGDPEPVQYAVETVRALIGRVPLMGICLGHQLLGLAAGGKTYKLKFGHRGGNHPVMDLTTGKVEITSHNHGFAVDPDSLPERDVQLTHINLNDQTLEGLRLKNAPAFSVQYHPEASPGPHDARYLFERFADLMREHHGARSF